MRAGQYQTKEVGCCDNIDIEYNVYIYHCYLNLTIFEKLA